jgi:dTDP-4-amino-4,6-dideoxygalactose transaminase
LAKSTGNELPEIFLAENRIDDDKDKHGRDLFLVADRRFSFVRLGHSFRATKMEAALGLAQLEERDQLNARRLEIVSTR